MSKDGKLMVVWQQEREEEIEKDGKDMREMVALGRFSFRKQRPL
jgi:hypothetical protein